MSDAGVALIVMAKQPRAGSVKTRLCPPCTYQQAAELAGLALVDTLETVQAVAFARRIVAFDGEPGSWVPAGFELVCQRGDGLGERIANALGSCDQPVLLIGMDTPQVSPSLLELAIDSLLASGVDAVLGPAYDGGYWALGMASPDPAALEGVPMSSSETGDAQRDRLVEMGLSVGLLPALRDVDVFDDALQVALEAPATRFGKRVHELAAKLPPARA